MKYLLSNEQLNKWLKNLLKFTAPAFAVLFSLLAQGVPLEKAWPLLLYAVYGLMADYFKKLGES
jgi:hypothetical protein